MKQKIHLIAFLLVLVQMSCSGQKRIANDVLDLKASNADAIRYHYKDYDFTPVAFYDYRADLPLNSTWRIVSFGYESYADPNYYDKPRYIRDQEVFNTIAKVRVIDKEKKKIEGLRVDSIMTPILDNDFDLSQVRYGGTSIFLVKGLEREQDIYRVKQPEFDYVPFSEKGNGYYIAGCTWACQGEEYKMTLTAYEDYERPIYSELKIARGDVEQILLYNFQDAIVYDLLDTGTNFQSGDIDGDGQMDIYMNSFLFPSGNRDTSQAAFILFLSSEAEGDEILKRVSTRIEDVFYRQD